ncbi:MAG TPA: hydrolase 2, exosortase A system-associated [Steroidobacteraceae bacterium]|nr:hydrolase 2, exosortase A system-associated [Steroidobacteraceae bacterium]
MTAAPVVPRFLGGDGERVFTLLRHPRSAGASCALLVAPFGEEMNKSRKMLTDVGIELAKRGIGSVLVDPYGTGDSEGDFSQADWLRWQADLRQAVAWCGEEGLNVDRLLGVRLGCALGAQVARDAIPGIAHTVFWQPVLDGSRFLDQFLRLRVAASMMDQDRKESTADLRARFARGEIVHVSGYGIAPRLAAQLDAVRLTELIGPHLGQIHWIEVVRSADTPPPAPATKAIDAARAAGMQVTLESVPGEPFWSSVEIVRLPQLIERTVALLEGAS